jgi:hypothetical protein
MQPAVGVLNNTRTVPEAKRLTIFAQPGGRPSSVTEITAGSAFHSAMVLGLLPREERVSSAAHIFSGGILRGFDYSRRDRQKLQKQTPPVSFCALIKALSISNGL